MFSTVSDIVSRESFWNNTRNQNVVIHSLCKSYSTLFPFIHLKKGLADSTIFSKLQLWYFRNVYLYSIFWPQIIHSSQEKKTLTLPYFSFLREPLCLFQWFHAKSTLPLGKDSHIKRTEVLLCKTKRSFGFFKDVQLQKVHKRGLLWELLGYVAEKKIWKKIMCCFRIGTYKGWKNSSHAFTTLSWQLVGVLYNPVHEIWVSPGYFMRFSVKQLCPIKLWSSSSFCFSRSS